MIASKNIFFSCNNKCLFCEHSSAGWVCCDSTSPPGCSYFSGIILGFDIAIFSCVCQQESACGDDTQGAHSNRVCMRMFIGVSMHSYIWASTFVLHLAKKYLFSVSVRIEFWIIYPNSLRHLSPTHIKYQIYVVHHIIASFTEKEGFQ